MFGCLIVLIDFVSFVVWYCLGWGCCYCCFVVIVWCLLFCCVGFGGGVWVVVLFFDFVAVGLGHL